LRTSLSWFSYLLAAVRDQNATERSGHHPDEVMPVERRRETILRPLSEPHDPAKIVERPIDDVGYGDFVPQDSVGRVIASFLLRPEIGDLRARFDELGERPER
jgi:hypothetical protein